MLGILPGCRRLRAGALPARRAADGHRAAAAAPDRYAGAASGVNNAVARAGTLLAVAALPALVGLSGTAYRDAAVFSAAYRTAMWICVGLLVAGGLVSWLLIRNTAENAPLAGDLRPLTAPGAAVTTIRGRIEPAGRVVVTPGENAMSSTASVTENSPTTRTTTCAWTCAGGTP